MPTTGAESDLQQVTQIAREMVVRWGMSSRVGPLNLSDDGNQGLGLQRPYSEATGQLIDDEVKRIAEECLAQATKLLEEHRSQLDSLAAALLERDSLNEEEILQVTGLPPAKVISDRSTLPPAVAAAAAAKGASPV